MNFLEIKRKVASYTIGIAGCGGLGSNCAQALVRSGVKKLIMADFDVVDESNLNRQFYFKHQVGKYKALAIIDNLKAINPEVDIISHNLKLDSRNIPEIFNNVDILVEAFDRVDMKQMLIETALECWPERPIVAASGLAGYGTSNTMKVKQYGKLIICGDQVTEVSANTPPLAPRVVIAAGMQANEVLRIILGEEL